LSLHTGKRVYSVHFNFFN